MQNMKKRVGYNRIFMRTSIDRFYVIAVIILKIGNRKTGMDVKKRKDIERMKFRNYSFVPGYRELSI